MLAAALRGPRPGKDSLLRIPDGVDDVTASTLLIAGWTADAVINAIGIQAGHIVLVGGAAGGVGVFAVQLVCRGCPGHRTTSDATAGFLRELSAELVTYGEVLAARVRVLAPGA